VRFESFGDADRTLVFVLGFGNEPDHEHVRWLIDRLAADYTVHVGVLPLDMTDFEADYRRPVERYASRLDVDAVLSHSTGGLVAAHLPLDARRVYLSPWWGFYMEGFAPLLFPIVRRLPTGFRFLPRETEPDPGEDLKSDGGGIVPPWVSPAFIREIHRAQQSLPEFRPGSTVFCSLTDSVVSTRAIGERAPADRIRLYDGGHEFFSSSGREAVLEDVRAALAGGPGAVDGLTADRAGRGLE
jgi:hypothetical protein